VGDPHELGSGERVSERHTPMLISRTCAYCGLQFTETVQPPVQRQWWRTCPRCQQSPQEPERS
jgi:hypothetical protein